MRYLDQSFDEESALYGLADSQLVRCRFAGPADGESALKEGSGLEVEDCDFDLRYPMWHVRHASIRHSRMSSACRAALWYCQDLDILDSYLGGIKALRECQGVVIRESELQSAELGWMCRDMKIEASQIESEYPFLGSSQLEFDQVMLKGKYSFQYVSEVVIRNSYLQTKDAFWHSHNLRVYDSVLEGEYLGWYSQNLHLIRCTIKGTQPLCYAKGLILEDCILEGCDLAFEKSEVRAKILGGVDSVKNPASGVICADWIGEQILDGECASECRVECGSARRASPVKPGPLPHVDANPSC